MFINLVLPVNNLIIVPSTPPLHCSELHQDKGQRREKGSYIWFPGEPPHSGLEVRSRESVVNVHLPLSTP